MDSAVPEPRLARANLLRVRGELSAAKETLLAILAECPNDRDTLSLLARTCEDAGEEEEARRWRTLAGDAAPDETSAGAAPALTLPSWTLPAVVVLGILVVALAFAIGRSSAKPVEMPVIGGRVEAPGVASKPSTTPPPEETSGSTIGSTSSPLGARNGGESGAEAAAIELLRAAEGGAGRTQGVFIDPRTETVTITFAPRPGETPRREAASLARTAFGTLRAARTLQMRALRGRELVYLATASRDKLAVVEAEGWARENEANQDALADALLTDEWSAPDGPGLNDASPATP